MANSYRGEMDAMVGGRERRLCLTLGAMAELEAAFGVDSLSALLARLGQGNLSARHIAAIVAAGLRGAGEEITDAEVAAMSGHGGVGAMMQVATELLAATFAPDAREMADRRNG